MTNGESARTFVFKKFLDRNADRPNAKGLIDWLEAGVDDKDKLDRLAGVLALMSELIAWDPTYVLTLTKAVAIIHAQDRILENTPAVEGV